MSTVKCRSVRQSGVNRGIETRAQIEIIIENKPRAGGSLCWTGAPRQALKRLEMGADAVLVNTIDRNRIRPNRMARLFSLASRRCDAREIVGWRETLERSATIR